jgi:hypothetical protein
MLTIHHALTNKTLSVTESSKILRVYHPCKPDLFAPLFQRTARWIPWSLSGHIRSRAAYIREVYIVALCRDFILQALWTGKVEERGKYTAWHAGFQVLQFANYIPVARQNCLIRSTSDRVHMGLVITQCDCCKSKSFGLRAGQRHMSFHLPDW